MTDLMIRFASGVPSGGSTSASCNIASTAIDAPTGPDGVAARPGIWAKTRPPVPMIRPARRQQTSMVPGNMMGAACSSRFDRRSWGGTGIGRDYTEGQEGLLAFEL